MKPTLWIYLLIKISHHTVLILKWNFISEHFHLYWKSWIFSFGVVFDWFNQSSFDAFDVFDRLHCISWPKQLNYLRQMYWKLEVTKILIFYHMCIWLFSNKTYTYTYCETLTLYKDFALVWTTCSNGQLPKWYDWNLTYKWISAAVTDRRLHG